MHEINFFDIIHFYTDASDFEEKLIIIQERNQSEQVKKISVLYDSVMFIFIQRKYVIYKKELCAMIKLIMKYDYLIKHFHHIFIIHIDHKSFIYFFISIADVHEKIYEH